MAGLEQLSSILLRLLVATVLGGLLGAEREVHGRWAGFRTHMMVSMGAAMFIMLSMGITSLSSTDLTRVVQGVATGIGFLGAGTILKLSNKLEVRGLTTASSIWLAAAVGTAAGMGQYTLAIAGAAVAFVVLGLLRPIDRLFAQKNRREK